MRSLAQEQGLTVERDRALKLELSQAVAELQSQDAALSGDARDLASNSKMELVELQNHADKRFQEVGAIQQTQRGDFEDQCGQLTQLIQKQDAEVRLLER